ncbi:MAG: GDSL-type esterase/lipase family protein [Clostridium sp.]|nr:GDSL-type esterase/lipase family protein [Lachnoclostridium sp.]MCM1254315.1 GDSL-type esterase/lipase family protein [Clostridium sp.]
MMKKIYNYVLAGVFTITALLVALVGLRAYADYMKEKELEAEALRQYQETVLARNREAKSRVVEIEYEITNMIDDVDALQAFIDNAVEAANEVQRRKESGETPASESGGAAVSDNDSVIDGISVSDNDSVLDSASVSGNETVSGNMTVSGNETVSGNMTVSGNETVSGNMTVSGNDTVSGNMTVSGNATVLGNDTVSGNADFDRLLGGVSGNNGEINYYDAAMIGSSIFDEWRYIYEQAEMTLEQRKELRTSYQETLEVNQADREWIAENKHDFSELKIACLGDSLTAAANLEGEENYIQYAYPTKLQELLGAKEVYNLGIGGSTIGRYWADAFVDRYTQIPEDADIIIVLGGANDGFCVSDEEFGNLEERNYRTFCGDLNELMKGLRENYPDTLIFFATPLPNVLQDYLMSEREYLLPQRYFVDAMKTLAQEYDFEVIDLYNSNILDSHDANVIAEYMPDGVHGNHQGYQILAEHFASEIVQYYNAEETNETEEADGEMEDGRKAETEADSETEDDKGADSPSRLNAETLWSGKTD